MARRVDPLDVAALGAPLVNAPVWVNVFGMVVGEVYAQTAGMGINRRLLVRPEQDSHHANLVILDLDLLVLGIDLDRVLPRVGVEIRKIDKMSPVVRSAFRAPASVTRDDPNLLDLGPSPAARTPLALED
jgi:hypothetical protein